MLGDQAAPAYGSMKALLCDPSPDVRAYAAWVCLRIGNAEDGLDTLKSMMESNSPAILTVLNLLDYMGEPAMALADTVAAIDPKKTGQANHVQRIQAYLVEKLAP